jgi:hypothetical protein
MPADGLKAMPPSGAGLAWRLRRHSTKFFESPGNFNLDLGVHRNFRFGERFRLSFRWEMFNALNRPNFTIPAAAIGNPQAGQIAGTAAARIMQMALKLNF